MNTRETLGEMIRKLMNKTKNYNDYNDELNNVKFIT